MNKKEQLQKKLNDIAENEAKVLRQKHFPKFKKLEGKCFKYKNSYSQPKKKSDYWFKYAKVIEVREEDVYDTRGAGVTCHCKIYEFQSDKDGNISIDTIGHSYAHNLGTEISEAEFIEAWNDMMGQLDKLI